MAGDDDLLVRLARAISSTPATHALSERLCLASRDLTGADAAALTVAYAETDRMTLYATDEVSARLEDLQEVMGQGPGYTASDHGHIEVCRLGTPDADRWPDFSRAALDLVGEATLHAVPMQLDGRSLGVMTLYQVDPTNPALAMGEATLLRLAAANGAALVRDPDSLDQEIVGGAWSSRARVHQATGMVVAQLGLSSEDALAVLKAHAYAGQTTLADIAKSVVARTIRFVDPPDETSTERPTRSPDERGN